MNTNDINNSKKPLQGLKSQLVEKLLCNLNLETARLDSSSRTQKASLILESELKNSKSVIPLLGISRSNGDILGKITINFQMVLPEDLSVKCVPASITCYCIAERL